MTQEQCDLMRDLADDLAAEIEARYANMLQYPTMRARFEGDMLNVYRARRMLAENADA